MNKLRTLPVVLLALIIGCASFEGGLRTSLASIIVAEEAAMKSWMDYVVTGKASVQEEIAVAAIHAKYQEALEIAESAEFVYRHAKKAATAEDKDLLQKEASLAITKAAELAAEVTALVKTLTKN